MRASQKHQENWNCTVAFLNVTGIDVDNGRTQLLLPPTLNEAFRSFEPRIVKWEKDCSYQANNFSLGNSSPICGSKNLNATFNVGGKSNWVRLMFQSNLISWHHNIIFLTQLKTKASINLHIFNRNVMFDYQHLESKWSSNDQTKIVYWNQWQTD